MFKSPLKIIFFGTPNFVVPVLQKLKENFTVAGVVTQQDQKVGRKQILTPSPIKLASQGPVLQGYVPKIFTPEKLDIEFAQKLQVLQPDLFVVAAYGKILPQYILDIPKFGALNIHPSLLPKYRGPSPIQSAVLNGDKTSGISIIKMDEKMDHGPVIYTEEFRLSNLDNFQTLSINMFLRASEILPKIITAFVEGIIKPVVQDDDIATYCNLVRKEDGYFYIDNPPSTEKLNRMIRAYYPWPTAWTRFRQGSSGQAKWKIVKFLPAELVQIEGKKAIKLGEFYRGYPDFPVKIF